MVYGLYDAAGNLRYIGSTTAPLETRLRRHFKAARGGSVQPVCKWIRESNDDLITIRGLVVVEDDDRYRTEKAAVGSYLKAGADLLNFWYTPEASKYVSKLLKGVPKSVEHRRKLSDSKRGVPQPIQTAAMHAARTGVKHSEETLAKMRLSHKHLWHKRKAVSDPGCSLCMEGK